MVVFGTETQNSSHFVLMILIFFLVVISRRPKRPQKLPKQLGGQFTSQFANLVELSPQKFWILFGGEKKPQRICREVENLGKSLSLLKIE